MHKHFNITLLCMLCTPTASVCVCTEYSVSNMVLVEASCTVVATCFVELQVLNCLQMHPTQSNREHTILLKFPTLYLTCIYMYIPCWNGLWLKLFLRRPHQNHWNIIHQIKNYTGSYTEGKVQVYLL